MKNGGYTPVEKRTKKQQREFYRKQRVFCDFNLGTRDMKNKKRKFCESHEIDMYI